ncbi:hypothetical protein [Nostoc parmelioides]|uniref:Uncharacterized protein n=1 Tax=Nostoc parmelioides FACHB-3921 TaxID=2692909 RepID=A0ABR8BQJ0_9NOSO|nr:hypothetical protein [Nostoc parmelioides]MBD2255840.1 hypothetical protein [Nostoc parmelioides FACHB-3921]
MKSILSGSTALLIGIVVALSLPKNAIAQDPSKLVDSIKSVAQVKKDLKQTLEALDRCGVGSCFNSTSTYICELVGALDVKVNGRIIGEMSGGNSSLPITASDLKLMKKIFSQCKPTNYQFWNWGNVLHVSYLPNTQVDRQIRAALGVKTTRR